jgi:hypothetical protein
MVGATEIVVLAQMDELIHDSFWPLVCLVVLAAAGTLLVSLMRRWAREPDPPTGAGFTLEQLRSLRKSGAMSEEEFQRAKGLIVKVQSAQLLSPSKTELKPTKPKGKL